VQITLLLAPEQDLLDVAGRQTVLVAAFLHGVDDEAVGLVEFGGSDGGGMDSTQDQRREARGEKAFHASSVRHPRPEL
jgi:hypothetical protein